MAAEKLTPEQKAERVDTAEAVGARIREERKKQRLTQRALAERAGYSTERRRGETIPVIDNMEKGNRGHLPGRGPLNRICEALGTTPNELLAGIPNPRKREIRTRR